MEVFKLLGTEFQKLTKKKTLLFAVFGVLLIPIIYVAVLLSATWGPYDYMDNLPVAVVNKDAGGVSSGEPINVGNDLVDTLKESKTLGWEFVSEKEADKGLKDNKYYLVIEIPEDFSQKVTTVLDANPQVPELRYIKNEGLNFMAAQITNSATERLREQLGDKITATYAKTVLSKFGDVGEGFTAGADGSNQIYEGTTQLADGTDQILSSLKGKTADIQKLATGAQQADQGAGKLLSAIKGGTSDINKLADGSNQVAAGTKSLSNGSKEILTGLKSASAGTTQLVNGIEKEMLPGAQAIAGGLNQINANIDNLNAGAQSVAGGLAQINANIDSLNTGAQSVANGLAQFEALIPALKANPALAPYADSLQQLIVGSKNVSTGVSGVTAGIKQLAPGSQQLSQGVSSVTTGVKQLAPGAQQLANGISGALPKVKSLSSGLNQLTAGQTKAVAGVESLASGASQVAAGNTTLTKSWSTLDNGVSSLKSGLSQISNGNKTVATGWSTLTNGVSAVNDGVLKLQNGSKELSTGLSDGAEQVSALTVTDNNINMFASPVKLTGETVNGYEFYRDSTAPYILSLALFVGILVLSFFVDFKKPAIIPSSAISWYASKWLQLAIFAIAQALVVSLFTLIALKLSVGSIPAFIFFTIFVSVTLMSIIFFLVALAGNIGRFVALIFIVLQLSTTGSNLPIPMLPENLQTLSKLLPLTYSNAGFKSIISLSDSSMTQANALVLFIYLVIFSVLAFIVFLFSYRTLSQNKPTRKNDTNTGVKEDELEVLV